MKLAVHEYEFTFPATAEPIWAKQVERWYQLDAYAYGLAQAFSVLREQLQAPPQLMILASPGSSGATDFDFVQADKKGASSPAKFVHTLPSVRGAPLMQLMGWSGELLCLQNDPVTWMNALEEALDLATSHAETWILQVQQKAQGSYVACFTELSTQKDFAQGLRASRTEHSEPVQKQDEDFWNWLKSKEKQFSLSQRWSLQKDF